ncbi:unnamed protein product [Hymenolepis diminuta]|uniref:Peptidase A2 domain-containing protein n=1 Tax=Hymenolepis diminuta TaxID=6216 RepID=A0A564YD18_HYMDI|nr:unnamed protein product [Hymenolepis diminuta]
MLSPYRGINYAFAHSVDAGVHSPDTLQYQGDMEVEEIIFAGITADRNSGKSYLIDSGAEIFVPPSTFADRTSLNHPLILAAANGSPIDVYDQKSVTLDLGLRRTFRWIFIIADVPKRIIGVDFLCHFDLLLDLRGNKLLDPLTSLHFKSTEYSCSTYSSITYIQTSESHF